MEHNEEIDGLLSMAPAAMSIKQIHQLQCYARALQKRHSETLLHADDCAFKYLSLKKQSEKIYGLLDFSDEECLRKH